MRKFIIILILMTLLWFFLRQYRGIDLKKVFYYEPMLEKGLDKAAGK